MSANDPEPTPKDTLGEGLGSSSARRASARRVNSWSSFRSGALTSVVAGVVTLQAGPHVGGILLAFPAILIVIEEEETGYDRPAGLPGLSGSLVG